MTILEQVAQACESALLVYRQDQETGADPMAISFDAGRVDGLKEALTILEKGTLLVRGVKNAGRCNK